MNSLLVCLTPIFIKADCHEKRSPEVPKSEIWLELWNDVFLCSGAYLNMMMENQFIQKKSDQGVQGLAGRRQGAVGHQKES